MPSWLGLPELLVILFIVVLIFGVGRLPETGEALGKAIRGFREAVSGKGEDAAEKKSDEDES
jgi:sec-independent protein translocase protein TatA